MNRRVVLKLRHPELEVAAAQDAAEQSPALAPEDVIDLLREAIPILNADNHVAHVEAVCAAIDRLAWAYLGTAPRDGTTVLMLFAGHGNWPPYVTPARWIIPEAGEPLNRHKSQLLDRFGGWWGSGRGKPHRTAALAWVPMPAIPTLPMAIGLETLDGCAEGLWECGRTSA